MEANVREERRYYGAGFGYGRRVPEPGNIDKFLEAGKVKETGFPLELQERI